MRFAWRGLVLAHVVVALPASAVAAADAAADGVVQAPPPPVEPAPVPAEADPHAAQREALFDVAFQALVAGRLDVAEEAFRQAAALSGDPTRSAVAASFADRVREQRRARVRRQPFAAAPAAVSSEARPPAAAASSEGREAARVTFVVTTTAMGLSVWGWALPSMFGLDPDRDTRAFVGLYMLTAGASFVVPALATRTDGVTPTQANLAFYGATRGLWHGLFLASILAGNVSTNQRFRTWSGSLLLGSAVEMAAGYAVGGDRDLSPGDAHIIGVAGDFGLGWGLATGALLGLHHDDRSLDAQARGMATAGLVGAAAGLTGGYALARRRRNTWGDAEVLRAAGLLGLWIGFTTDLLFEWDPGRTADEKKAFATLMVGGALGLAVGDRLVRHTDFSVSESLLIDLSTVASGLAAAGISFVATSGSSENSGKGFAVAAAVGALAGFAVSYGAFRDDATRRGARAASDLPRETSVALVPVLGGHGERGFAVAGIF